MSVDVSEWMHTECVCVWPYGYACCTCVCMSMGITCSALSLARLVDMELHPPHFYQAAGFSISYRYWILFSCFFHSVFFFNLAVMSAKFPCAKYINNITISSNFLAWGFSYPTKVSFSILSLSCLHLFLSMGTVFNYLIEWIKVALSLNCHMACVCGNVA